MNGICIIPARGGSKGIPNKNITNFLNKPLIYWTIDQAKNSKYLQNIYVSSDSEEILDISKKYGAIPIKRPADIAGDTAKSEDALIHTYNTIKEKIDFIVFLQVSSPIRESKDIDNAIELFNTGYDSVFSAIEIEDFLIWINKNNKLISLNYNFKNRQRRQDCKKQYVENGSIYVFKPHILLSHGNRLGGNIGLSIMQNWKVYEIDKPEDIFFCELIYRNYIHE